MLKIQLFQFNWKDNWNQSESILIVRIQILVQTSSNIPLDSETVYLKCFGLTNVNKDSA